MYYSALKGSAMSNEKFKNFVGLDAYAAKLKALPTEVSNKILRRVAASGVTPVKKQLIDDAPVAATPHFRGKGNKVEQGTIKRAVYATRYKTDSGDLQQAYAVSIRYGKRNSAKNRDAYYWRWVDEGHRIVPRKGTKGAAGSLYSRRREARYQQSQGRGTVPAKPFFRPAFDKSATASLDRMVKTLGRLYKREIEK